MSHRPNAAVFFCGFLLPFASVLYVGTVKRTNMLMIVGCDIFSHHLAHPIHFLFRPTPLPPLQHPPHEVNERSFLFLLYCSPCMLCLA